MSDDVLYRLNDRDEVSFVNDAWDRFARDNGAAGPVLGRRLWDFIEGPTTRQLYRELLARVRAGHRVRFPFRCDSPACRRLLEMTIGLAEGGAVEFRTRTLREEPRAPQRLLAAEAPRSEELLRACGWCKRVEAEGAWVEVEEAVGRLGLFERERLPMLTHGVCDDCYRAMTKAPEAE